MNLSAVLVIGSSKNALLADALFECGLTPVFKETILAVIAALRKERFMAVVIDQETSVFDPLEIILNIRDVDDRLRIFLLAKEGEKTGQSPYREFLTVVHREALVHKLTPTTVPVPGTRPGKTAPANRVGEDARQ